MMPFFYMWHPADLLVIPAVIFAVWAQARVRSTYRKYANILIRKRVNGAQAADQILRDARVGGLDIEAIPGEMTDHYDPVKKALRLSRDVYSGSSVAAVGIAAHEAGHALQDAQGYLPMRMRHVMYPLASIGSSLAFPLILIGMIFNASGTGWMINLGIWLFSASVVFTLVTLPVEFDASRRALRALANGGYLEEDELNGVRKVLTAAALTYVAAAAVAVLQLVRLLIIARGRN